MIDAPVSDAPSNDNASLAALPEFIASRPRASRTVSRGGRISGYQRGASPLAYNCRERRLANLTEAVARHERDLAAARVSAADGGKSRSVLMQLTRRLHRARDELADLQATG